MRNKCIMALWMHEDPKKERSRIITDILVRYNVSTEQLDDLITLSLIQNDNQSDFDLNFNYIKAELKERKRKKRIMEESLSYMASQENRLPR